MRTKHLLCILITIFFITQNIFAENNKLDLIATWFAGQYSTTEQAKNDSQFIDIHLEITHFSIEEDSGKWFYLETSFSSSSDDPYRQEVYHFYNAKLDFIYLDVYEILDKKQFIGAFSDKSLLKNITFKQLQKKEKCTVYLTKLDEIFIGGTSGKLCSSEIQNSSYAKTDIEITPIDFFLWERGYDTRNRHVWGSEDNGFIFIKYDN